MVGGCCLVQLRNAGVPGLARAQAAADTQHAWFLHSRRLSAAVMGPSAMVVAQMSKSDQQSTVRCGRP